MQSELGDQDYATISKLANDKWGLVLSESKRTMVAGRLGRLAKKLNCADIGSLIHRMDDRRDNHDMVRLFDVLSTNETSFLRHPPHFEILRDEICSFRAAHPSKEAVRVWSAGCSTGCEAYTIGMVLHEALVSKGTNVKILATDYSVSVLEQAKHGIYTERAVRGLSAKYLNEYFERIEIDEEPMYRVLPKVRNLVTIGMINLMKTWPMKGPFDAIFCCNVMIYFDVETRHRLIERFRQLLRPDGLLVLGSSESLIANIPGLERVHSSCLRRVA